MPVLYGSQQIFAEALLALLHRFRQVTNPPRDIANEYAPRLGEKLTRLFRRIELYANSQIASLVEFFDIFLKATYEVLTCQIPNRLREIFLVDYYHTDLWYMIREVISQVAVWIPEVFTRSSPVFHSDSSSDSSE